VAELDEHVVLAELIARPFEVVDRRLARDDVGSELHEDAAELAGRAERLERLAEAPEDLGAELSRRALDAALVVRRSFVAEVGR
jgi:hypothetical protein